MKRCLRVHGIGGVVVVVLVHGVLFISILHCLKAPLSAQPPHANKSLLSLFEFANANQSLARRTDQPELPVYQTSA